jgi:hypothetical protein
MKEEIYRDVVGYEGLYQVSNLGNVRRIGYEKERVLKPGIDRYGYTQVNISKDGERKMYKIHFLVGITFLSHISDGYETVIDHVNGIKSDNRLENLRLVTQRENTTFGYLKKETSSKYTGVYWNKYHKKWKSRIYIKGKQKHLGYFTNEEEAAQAYQKALEQHKKGLL